MKTGFLRTAIACAAASLMIASVSSATAADILKDLPITDVTIEQGKNSEFTISVAAGDYRDGAGVTRSFAKSASWTCVGKSNNPHWSNGSNGVIAKAQISCTGTNATLPIRVQQYLGRTTQNNISTLQIVRESNYVQNVTVNMGWSSPWYVPALGTPGAPRGAYFRASHSAQASAPLLPLNIGAGNSVFLYVA